jgi:uncharacterized protein YraI
MKFKHKLPTQWPAGAAPAIAWRCLRVCALLVMLLASATQPTPIASARLLAQDDQLAGPQALVTRNTNIRRGPGTDSPVLTVARPGERYPITGQTADGSWWRIDYNGQTAWIFASLVQVDGEANVPVIEPGAGGTQGVPASGPLLPTPTPDASTTPTPPLPAATPAGSNQATAQVIRNINVRSGPGLSFRILATARAGERFPITGKSVDGAWWRIDYNGQEAWLFASLVQLIRQRPAQLRTSVRLPAPVAPSA